MKSLRTAIIALFCILFSVSAASAQESDEIVAELVARGVPVGDHIVDTPVTTVDELNWSALDEVENHLRDSSAGTDACGLQTV